MRTLRKLGVGLMLGGMSAMCVLTLWAAKPVEPMDTALEVPGMFPRISDAIERAQQGDIIVVAPGTYTESLFLVGRKSCANEEGILAPANLTIRTTNPRRPGDTMLKGLGNDAVLTFTNGVSRTVRIEGFVITGGNNALGGGIRCEDSNPTIAYCHIGRNQAGVGGGVYCKNSNPLLIESSIVMNQSVLDGAGIYIDAESHPVLEGCILYKNISSEWKDRGRECFIANGGSARLVNTVIRSFQKTPMDSTLTFWDIEAGRPLLESSSAHSPRS